MSVFTDFQRLWIQRFPQSSLSDAWEQDVRASLERHKQKILELTKELEQETLYVEYLERLLSDVEKYKESGGDPTTLFEQATASNTIDAASEIATASLDGAASSDTTTEDNKDIEENVLMRSKTSDNLKQTPNRDTNKYSRNTYNSEAEDKDCGTEKDLKNIQIQKHGALNQCINELASGFQNQEKEEPQKRESPSGGNSKTENPSQEPTHFVTVIEVKESKQNKNNTDGDSTASSAATSQTRNSCIVSAITENEANSTASNKERHSSESEIVTLSSFERNRSKFGNNNIEPTAPPMSPSMSASTTGVLQSSSSSNILSSSRSSSGSSSLETKKKVPPRPPPKFIRRVEPPTVPGLSSPKYKNSNEGSNSSDSPCSSLERNIKPSDILRQKSDSLDAKALASNRRTTPETGRFTKSSDLAEELGRKIGKTDSLEKTQRTEIIFGKINQSPTGSLNKATVNLEARSSPISNISNLAAVKHESPTGSLEKMALSGKDVGSRESLASQGNISEIIKSYESISSLSSDSAKANQTVGENEPYYDTVPMDNGDGEYVYITKPQVTDSNGRAGSNSSRDDLSTACSTLPMPPNPRNSEQSIEPESPGRNSNYVNIDYFLHQSNEQRSSSVDSDGELETPPIMRAISVDEHQTTHTPGALRKNSSSLRGSKIRSILNSIIQSETIYVECLNKMMQYKKAIHATLGSSQPVIKMDEENTMFFKIDELHAAHTEFLADLKKKLHQDGDILVGDAFKRLADIIDLYSAFLHNYGQAIETVKKCSANNPQFKTIVSTIVLNLQNEHQLPLEDLLHKPVARVQINALVFNDLLNETPPQHPDYHPLRQAQKTIHVFLKQFNVVNQRFHGESKNLRRMVKNSFIVELVDGHRKLRHLFLFNDVIACTKYKPTSRDGSVALELKWFISLKDVIIYEEDTAELKESNPANILQLKSQACTVRDQLLLEEKDDKKKSNGVRMGDKHRRKLAELEIQLVLASPNLVFRIGNRTTNKTMTFFLSSDFERTQWIDKILNLKQSCNLSGTNSINSFEIEAFVIAMQSSIKSDMGSYLLRNRNDESLLVGDLHITIQGLTGLEQPADMYICLEVDSYGHYFRKAKTKMVCRSTSPLWSESFVLELEGSQNVRILLYEAQEHRPILRAKYVLKLSRSWLKEAPQNTPIRLSESITLSTSIRFVPGEVTLRRVPTSKAGALFGAKLDQVRKREKRDIPFIISACIREVERRGMAEVGIYRVSGSASDLAKLKKTFETNAYEAEQLLKEVDIHSVTGILKSYLRELPEALFTDALYPRLFETFNQFSNINEAARIESLMQTFNQLPPPNRSSISLILDHLIRVHQQEAENKMSLHNLAMVFGPTLLRPGQTQSKQKNLLESSTVDVMAQAGILYSFLQARIKKD